MEVGVDASVGGVFFVVEGTDVGGHECLDAVLEGVAGARRTIDGPIRALVDLTVDPLTDTRARLTIAIDFDGHRVGSLLVPAVVRREARKEMPANPATLEQRLEVGASSGSA